MYARIGNMQLYDHAIVILGRIKLFVIAVEKTTAGRLQQLQRGGRLVGLIIVFYFVSNRSSIMLVFERISLCPKDQCGRL